MRARRSRGIRRLTPGRLAAVAVASLAGLFVAWWVVRTSVVWAEDENPFAAATIDPGHPRVRIGLATAYFELQGGRVPAPVERSALAALKRAPLADEPFLLAGVAALARNDVARGERLLTEARRRNPRLRMARLLLLDRYLREHRIAEATVEVAALSRLIAGAGTILTQELVQLVRDPATAAQTIPILRTRPELLKSVLQDLARSNADPNLILRVAGPSLGPADPSDAQWQEPLLDRMVDGGKVAEAVGLWKRFAGIADSGQGKGLYDGGFRGLPGPAPFNWKLAAGGMGVAERTKGALRVDYYGRDNGDLASQLLVLAPGRYRLTFRVQGDAPGEGSRLVWTLACHPGGAPIAQLPLTGIASTPRRLSVAVTIPSAGCPAQWLRLQGKSGDVATTQDATFSEFSIAREGGS